MVFLQTYTIPSPGGRTLPGVLGVRALILFCFITLLFFQPVEAQTVTDTITPTPTVISTPAPTPTTPLPSVTPTPSPLVQEAQSITSTTVSSPSATLNVVTIVNTNAPGATPTVLNYTDPTAGTIDLSQTAPMSSTPSAAPLIQNAVIQNTIDVNSITNPSASASATANVFNMTNTTLSGVNWKFAVINFFAPHTGDVTLPSYQNVTPTLSTMKPATVTVVAPQNTATITNTLSAVANTAPGTGTTIQTGNAQSTVFSQEVLNTTINGDNWLLLTIRSYGGWNGSLLNWPGAMSVTPTETIAFLPLSPISSDQSNSFLKNTATVNNFISAFADSGGKGGADGNIKTGSANATVRLFDLLNTTLSGNNWYFAYVTIFDTFNGNILFPQTTRQIVIPVPSIAESNPNQEPHPPDSSSPQTASPIVSEMPIPSPTPVVVVSAPVVLSAKSLIATPTPEMKPTAKPVSSRTTKTGYTEWFYATTAFMAAAVKRYQILREKIPSRRRKRF